MQGIQFYFNFYVTFILFLLNYNFLRKNRLEFLKCVVQAQDLIHDEH